MVDKKDHNENTINAIYTDYKHGKDVLAVDLTKMMRFDDNGVTIFPSHFHFVKEDKDVNSVLNRHYRIKRINSYPNEYFDIPEFIARLQLSPLWIFPKDHSFSMPCPDVLAKDIVELGEDIVNKSEAPLSSLDKIFNQHYSYIFNDYLNRHKRNHVESDYDYIHGKTVDNAIIEKFTNSRFIGKKFFNHLMSNPVSKALSDLSVFVLVNEIIDLYVNDDINLSIREIFPESFNNKIKLEDETYRNDGFSRANPVYDVFLQRVYRKFNKLSFSENDYTDKLAHLIFSFDPFDRIEGDANFTLEGAYKKYGQTGIHTAFNAKDFISILDNLTYHHAYKTHTHNGKTTSIEELYTELALTRGTVKFEYTKVSQPRKMLSAKIYNTVRRKEDNEQLTFLHIVYRDFIANMVTMWTSEQVLGFRQRLSDRYILPVTDKALEINHERDYSSNMITPVEAYSAAFLIALIDYYKHSFNLSKYKTKDEVIKVAGTIFDNDKFFDNLQSFHLLDIAKAYVDNAGKIPVNIIRSTISI